MNYYADVLCPWCYIGHRRLRAATAGRPGSVHRRAFELAPALSREPGTTAAEQMADASWWGRNAEARIAEIRATGASEGVELNLHLARPVNSFDAHRLVKLAAAHDRDDEVLEAVLFGYHTEGRNIADHAVLEDIGVAAGLERRDVRSTLAGSAFGADVRADERAARSSGVTGVPSLVIDGAPPVSGVLPVDALADLIA
ncbi:DsbA family oxidoreductase [Cryptosporangium aurantiacum]|uniref:DsbA family oxidoreductase n=1 Tax=Cryptosporangium aurantiacum TaxID=134849 RepID=UPI00093556E0|nr:DsbA family oxidoreductase [Cryptosporangium aurantiacum]